MGKIDAIAQCPSSANSKRRSAGSGVPVALQETECSASNRKRVQRSASRFQYAGEKFVDVQTAVKRDTANGSASETASALRSVLTSPRRRNVAREG